MSVTLRTTVGTVNYTDWLHITACKVVGTGGPGAVVWQTWIDVPITNYNLIIPNLDPENYIISFYDAPTNSSLGTLTLQLIVNALTNEWSYERRFYTCGGSNPGDPAVGDAFILDPYLIGKNVTGTFKEGFRYFEPTAETTFDDTTGQINILNGTTFAADEKFSVELKYAVGVQTGGSGNGLYNGMIDISSPTRLLLPAEVNNLCRLVGSASTQQITLPLLSSIAIDNGYYFDNSVGGTAVCVQLYTNGSDKIHFNGFNTAATFTEFWVGRGEHLLLKKLSDSYWEVRLDYAGVNVGEIVMAGIKSHPMILTENGQLVDGDEYGRLYWWIMNVLPSTHKYTTDTVTDGGFTHTANKRGQFAVHSTLKKFRMPATNGLVPKGLANYEAYGTDTANRPVDAPGGIQVEMIKKHRHWTTVNAVGTSGFSLNSGTSIMVQKDDGGEFKYILVGNAVEPSIGRTSEDFGGSYNFGAQQRVDNNGVIFARRA